MIKNPERFWQDSGNILTQYQSHTSLMLNFWSTNWLALFEKYPKFIQKIFKFFKKIWQILRVSIPRSKFRSVNWIAINSFFAKNKISTSGGALQSKHKNKIIIKMKKRIIIEYWKKEVLNIEKKKWKYWELFPNNKYQCQNIVPISMSQREIFDFQQKNK